MQRLVEGSESVSQRCDQRDEEPEQDCTAHRRRTISETHSRNECCTSSMGEGSQGRNREGLRNACYTLRLSRNWMRLIVVLIVICMLMSIVSLVLAVLTSLNVAKLEDSSLLAVCPKGNEEPIDCKGIQAMRKSLKDALRKIGKLANLKNASVTVREEKQTIVSKHTQGLPSASVAREPSCHCNLQLCSYKLNKTDDIPYHQAPVRATVSATEPKDTKFLGVYCETNDATVEFSSKILPDGERSYECKCKSVENTQSSSLYCRIHYWQCPI